MNIHVCCDSLADMPGSLHLIVIPSLPCTQLKKTVKSYVKMDRRRVKGMCSLRGQVKSTSLQPGGRGRTTFVFLCPFWWYAKGLKKGCWCTQGTSVTSMPASTPASKPTATSTSAPSTLPHNYLSASFTIFLCTLPGDRCFSPYDLVPPLVFVFFLPSLALLQTYDWDGKKE